MSRPKGSKRTPSYCLHKGTGQAYCTLNGRDIYLGKHGTDASRAEYDRVVGEWLASGRAAPAPVARGPDPELTIVELVDAYYTHCESYYRRADGTPTGEAATIAQALRVVKRLYARTPVVDFGPLALKACRDVMMKEPAPEPEPTPGKRRGWCRTNINKHVGRVKAMFKWAAGNEMVPAAIHHALQAVAGLRAGRSTARESEPVRPAPAAHVEAVLPLLSDQVAAMVRLQLLTGMRPGEVVVMRRRDIDASGPVWLYVVASHKTQHHGHRREVRIGPRAQEVLRPFLRPDLDGYLFSPIDVVAKLLADRRANRKTPARYGNSAGTNRKAKPKRRPRERYDVGSYRVAVARACVRACVPAWHPHQLRHNAATEFRKRYGLDAARVLLGHRSAVVTEIYAEVDVQQAVKIMAEVG